MHFGARILSALGLMALVVAGTASATVTASAKTDSASRAGTNTVAGFDRHGDGTLTPIDGSPFVAGGAGKGTIIGSQGALQLAGEGRYLLAVDAGSNQISVLRIRSDGTLRQVEGGLVSSGGIEPISIAVHGSLVSVANEGNGTSGSNYTGFVLKEDGRLVSLGQSTVALPATANPGDILFNSTGTSLIGVEVGTADPSTFRIDSFVVAEDGRLSPAAGSPFPAQAAGPFGSEFSPTDPSRLYVSNAHGGAGNGSISAFNVPHNGVLSSIGGSPYADGRTAPCWVEITHDGKFLFTVNTGSTDISSYRILSDGSLKLQSTTGFSSGTGIRPFDARLDPSGTTLYVVDAALDAVSGFSVNGGSLTELHQSPFPLPAGATPFGIVVTGSSEGRDS
jgi:6-phosphogluconolactonase